MNRRDVAAPTTLMARRRAWARALINRCATPPPRYGSEEWLALEEGNPRKVAAVVVAAEAWARDGEELPVRLRREVEALSLAHKQTEDVQFNVNAREHKRRYRWLGSEKHSRVAPIPPRPTPPPAITVHAGTHFVEAHRAR